MYRGAQLGTGTQEAQGQLCPLAVPCVVSAIPPGQPNPTSFGTETGAVPGIAGRCHLPAVQPEG